MREKLDYLLVLLTYLLLALLALLFLYATFFVWWQEKVFPGWEATERYSQYVLQMNLAAFPLAVLLVLLLVLCLERRSLSPRQSGFVLAAAIVPALLYYGISGSWPVALAYCLALVFGYQLYLPFSRRLKSEKAHFSEKVGSLLLHAGYTLLTATVTAFYHAAYHLTLFWISLFLILGGNFLSFYGRSVFRWSSRS